MPKTYYDSELTGAQIESALKAIHGVVTPSNNGKVLCIDNGAIAAKSASEWGHGAVLEPLNVTANGDYTPPSGTDGFDEVHVAVPSATLTTKNITSNGTYNASSDNADGYSSVTVAVPGGATVQPLSVTENGTYTPPSGVDGYAPVTVNVSGGGIDDWASLTNYIESSGTQYIDTGYTLPADQSGVRFEVVCNFSQVGKWPTIYGVRDAASKYGATLWVRDRGTSNMVALAWCGNTINTYVGCYATSSSPSSASNSQPPYGVKVKIEVNQASAVFSTQQYRNHLVVQNGSIGNATTQFSLYLFNFNQANAPFADGYCTMKLYRFRIYHGDTLAHEFIPWQENGVACLKDTVTSEIKYNAGTGNFVYGTDT